MMILHEKVTIIEEVLDHWAEVFAQGVTPYRNHCHRVLNFCLAFSGEGVDAFEKTAIAAVFHDLGIWTHQTFDYLEPSRQLARDYLVRTNRPAWCAEIDTMIDQHHKLTAHTARPDWLVEPFRKADWVDVTLGLRRFGLPPAFVREVRAAFPNAGFHKELIMLGWQRFKTHPFSPLPMMRL